MQQALSAKDKEIVQLKILGHDLLDEYINLDLRRGEKKERIHAYKKLTEKLERPFQFHFSQIHTKYELEQAIVHLRRMIEKRKSKLAHESTLHRDEYADPALVRAELAKIKAARLQKTTPA